MRTRAFLFATAVALGSGFIAANAGGGAAAACAGGDRSPDRGRAAASHAYFERLIARQECVRAYSLRDNTQLIEYKQSRSRPPSVTYDPASDTDARRQDAAKIVVPADRVSLPNQLRLPLETVDGTSTLVTWDAWFGSEFKYANTRIGNYKTFQFASPKDRIWFEVRTRFSLEEGGKRRMRKSRGKGAADGGGDYIGAVDARAYGKKGERLAGPNVSRTSPLSPQAGSFTVRAETWTRYWVLVEQRANDWDLVSLWVADERNGPVKLIDRRELSVHGSVEEFWLEYNTSSNQRPPDRGPLVAYARNVVVLRNVGDVAGLLERPAK